MTEVSFVLCSYYSNRGLCSAVSIWTSAGHWLPSSYIFPLGLLCHTALLCHSVSIMHVLFSFFQLFWMLRGHEWDPICPCPGIQSFPVREPSLLSLSRQLSLLPAEGAGLPQWAYGGKDLLKRCSLPPFLVVRKQRSQHHCWSHWAGLGTVSRRSSRTVNNIEILSASGAFCLLFFSSFCLQTFIHMKTAKH